MCADEAELLRVPGEKTSVMVLCNLATADPEERANRVADIVLRGRLPEPAPQPDPGRPGPDTRAPTAFGGTYWHEERMLVARFASHERGLALVVGGQRRPLETAGGGVYRVRDQSTRYRWQTLVVRDLRAPARVLTPAFRDVFTSNGFVVKFDADRSSGFVVGAGRARGMRFTRRAP